MIQATNTDWNAAVAGLDSARFERNMTAMQTSMAVSSHQPLALVEPQAGHESVALNTQSTYRQSKADVAESPSLYGADTVVMALGLIGAWMMLVGGAMLSRRLAAFKLQGGAVSAAQHQ